MRVPNESLAIIIGKNSDTLKMLKNMSGVQKIQIANEGIPGCVDRNCYIFGEKINFEKCKSMIGEIVDKHRQLKSVNNLIGTQAVTAAGSGPVPAQTKQTIELSIPNNMGNKPYLSRTGHWQKWGDNQIYKFKNRSLCVHSSGDPLWRSEQNNYNNRAT
jgi:hypothetical protein